MEPEKAYDPQETITITLAAEQWETVRHWLTYGMDYHRAKMTWWAECCKDPHMAAEKAAEHEKAATQAGTLCKIIEETINPPPTKETE